MLVGCKDLVCRLQRPRAGNPHLRGCTGWLWHLPRGWVPTAQLSSCPGRIGRASWSSHRSPGPSFTLRVFVNRCVGLLLTEQYILDAAEPKKVCVCVCWCSRMCHTIVVCDGHGLHPCGSLEVRRLGWRTYIRPQSHRLIMCCTDGCRGFRLANRTVASVPKS